MRYIASANLIVDGHQLPVSLIVTALDPGEAWEKASHALKECVIDFVSITALEAEYVRNP